MTFVTISIKNYLSTSNKCTIGFIVALSIGVFVVVVGCQSELCVLGYDILRRRSCRRCRCEHCAGKRSFQLIIRFQKKKYEK